MTPARLCACPACDLARTLRPSDLVRATLRDAYARGFLPLTGLAVSRNVTPSIMRNWAREERWTRLREEHRKAVHRQARSLSAVEIAIRGIQRTTGLDRLQAIHVVLGIAASLELTTAGADRLEVA